MPLSLRRLGPAAAVVAAWGIWAGSSQAAPLASVDREAGTSKQEILDFWTPRKMRQAEPLDRKLPNGAPLERAPADEPGAPHAVPPTDGPSGGVDSGTREPLSTETETRATAAKGFESSVVAFDRSFPNSTNGKVFGRIRGVGAYQCSATVVRARNRSLVFTAGHCVKEPHGRWARDFIFVPAYRDGERPFQAWAWRDMVAPAEWTRRGNYNFDFGAVIVGQRQGVTVQQAVGGGQGFAWGQPRHQVYRAFGYPENRRSGEQMWSCRSGYRGADPRPYPVGPPAMGIGCDMGAGASGGGWVVQRDGRYLNSVTSFQYDRFENLIFGPYFGTVAGKLWRRAGRL